MFRRAIKRPRLPLNEVNVDDPGLALGCEESPINEHNLEKLVFGEAEDLLDKFQTSFEKKEKEHVADSNDEEADSDINSDDNESSEDSDEEPTLKTSRVDDSEIKKIQKKKTKDQELHSESDSSSDEDDITKQVDNYLHDKCETLSQGFIRIKRVRDLNYSSRNEGSILRAVEFHPSATVALVAGKAGIATLFQVDGQTNPKIQSIKFKKFPISTAHFSADGQEFIVGSYNTGVTYYYDMIAGKICKVPWQKDMGNKNMGDFVVSPDNSLLAFLGMYGKIHILTAKTKEWIGSLKINNQVRAVAFNKDGSRLFAHGNGGEVYVFDMSTRDCIHKFYDDGCVNGTLISISPDSNRVVCGSDSGIVNVYDYSKIWTSTPKPSKIFLNLTTSIFGIKINHSNELMVMSSDVKDNAIKLAHLQSMTVFNNFPENSINMKKPLCFDLSLNSGYLAIGNNMGTAFLYRLKHYKSF